MSKKHGLDQFYTKEEVSLYLISKIDLSKFNTIVEPSAGSGAFSKFLPNCFAYDIEPAGPEITKADFLTIETNFLNPVLTIGNPPFGDNNSLALKFIKKASTFSDVIAFILPLSFKKRSLYDKIPLNFWKVYTEDLPINSFIYKEQEVNIPCAFFIFEKKVNFRTKEIKLKPKKFIFSNKKNGNISIRRVGINAGRAFASTNTSKESHYFIKYNGDVNYFIKKVNELEWNDNNTVGPKSISKNELIEKLDFYL